MKPSRFSWGVRLSVSIAVLALLLRMVPLERLSAAFHGVSLGVWTTVLSCFLAGHVVCALKWRLLLQLNHEIPVAQAIRAHFAGLVANLSLPGAAGGDVVRAAWVMKDSDRRTGLAMASVADRLIDVLALLLLSGAGLLWTADAVGLPGRLLFVAGMTVLLGVLAGGAAILALHRWGRLRVFGLALEAVGNLGRKPWRLFACLALSITVQASFVGLNMLLAAGAGVRVPTAAWFIAWPLSKLVATLPISLGGLGVRESALVALLAPFGADAAAVMATGLLWQGMLITSGIVGGLLVFAPRGTVWLARERSSTA